MRKLSLVAPPIFSVFDQPTLYRPLLAAAFNPNNLLLAPITLAFACIFIVLVSTFVPRALFEARLPTILPPGIKATADTAAAFQLPCDKFPAVATTDPTIPI